MPRLTSETQIILHRLMSLRSLVYYRDSSTLESWIVAFSGSWVRLHSCISYPRAFAVVGYSCKASSVDITYNPIIEMTTTIHMKVCPTAS